MSQTRRQFLGTALASALTFAGLSDGNALGKRTLVKLAQLRYAGNWNPRPNARTKLAQELRFRTSVPVDYTLVNLSLDDPKLFYHPLLILCGDRPFTLSDDETRTLRRYLSLGGFLWIDAADFVAGNQFDASVRKLVGQLFGARKLSKLPSDHVVFRSFYRVSSPAGRVLVRDYLEGVTLDRRLCILYTPNDVFGALEQVALGNWKYDVSPGGAGQRQMAMRLAINIVEYALCLNYKSDQVHLDYLLRKRQWYIRRPTRP
ncbi:MAG: DUF4159 domain-containing protein [Myxococcales bacterium]|nr:DUF4159 domain-containing protein [Myxococcales bacterium]